MSYRLKILCTIIFLLILSLILFVAFKSRLPEMHIKKSHFRHLSLWEKDEHRQSLIAFKASCTEINKRNPTLAFSRLAESGLNQDWQKICKAAAHIPNKNKQAKEFFEKWFRPYKVTANGKDEGIFTGYYLPLLKGSLTKTKHFKFPIYGVPTDLVKVNLGNFSPKYKGSSITGRLQNNTLVPYFDRKTIESTQLSAPVLAWSDSLIELFFAQIQGSAIVELPNREKRLLGYAGTNGRAYTPIGKVLIEKDALNPTEISMQTIKKWLLEHPKNTPEILNHNASFVFFTFLKQAAPLGAERVGLTPTRSLAVDARFIPYGMPIWLETTAPIQKKNNSIPFHHLMIAQDTGGAIKGVIRGDVYWGEGNEAAFAAGHMNNKGKYWLLVPRKITLSA